MFLLRVFGISFHHLCQLFLQSLYWIHRKIKEKNVILQTSCLFESATQWCTLLLPTAFSISQELFLFFFKYKLISSDTNFTLVQYHCPQIGIVKNCHIEKGGVFPMQIFGTDFDEYHFQTLLTSHFWKLLIPLRSKFL